MEKSIETIWKEGFLKNVSAVKDKAGSVADNVNDKVRGVVNNNN